MNTDLGSHFPGRWKCLSALVEEMPRVGSPEGLTVQASWFMKAAAPSPPAGGLSVICHKSSPVPSLWSSKESVKVLCLVQHSHHRGGAAGPQGGQHLSRVTLCVAESESGPGALSPGRLPIHGPTRLVTSVAAASSRLGFCPVHPHSALTCPVLLRRALTAG